MSSESKTAKFKKVFCACKAYCGETFIFSFIRRKTFSIILASVEMNSFARGTLNLLERYFQSLILSKYASLMIGQSMDQTNSNRGLRANKNLTDT